MAFDDILARYTSAADGFTARLVLARPADHDLPTPCPEWTVRQLVNHMTRGNLNYVLLAGGGTAAEFVRLRHADALGDDPLGAYTASVEACRDAFAAPGVLGSSVDYPFGRIPAAQALAVRTADSVVHTWDLARALGVDDVLDPGLVRWIDEHAPAIYAGLPEMPVSARRTHREFAAPVRPADGADRQARLLGLMGRPVSWRAPAAGSSR